MGTKTLWKLPAQQLPTIVLPRPVFVTIWFFVCLGFVILFRRVSRYRSRNVWPEFKNIRFGAYLLSFWYFFAVIDRWLHYDRRSVPLGYIIAVAVWEFARVGSAILLLWGTYLITWREMTQRVSKRFSENAAKYWWSAAQAAIFVVALVSLFYVVLNLALAIVWMNFLSLNIIGDIATKKKNFEISTAVFHSIFALLTAIAGFVTFFIKAPKKEDRVPKNSLFVFFGAIFLLVRSVLEIGLSVTEDKQKADLARDISYGLVTCCFFALMYAMARVMISDESETVRVIEASVRKSLIERLENITESARTQSPPFAKVLQEARQSSFQENPLRVAMQITRGDSHDAEQWKNAERVANEYLNQLQHKFGSLNPRLEQNYAQRHSGLRFSSLGGRLHKPFRHPHVRKRSSGGLGSISGNGSHSGQNSKYGGTSRNFSPTNPTSDAPSDIPRTEAPFPNRQNSFDFRSTYTSSTDPRYRGGRRTITAPMPFFPRHAHTGQRYASSPSPAPSILASSMGFEVGDTSPRLRSSSPVYPSDRHVESFPAMHSDSPPIGQHPASRLRSQPAMRTQLAQSSSALRNEYPQMRFGPASQQRNRPRYEEGQDMEMMQTTRDPASSAALE